MKKPKLPFVLGPLLAIAKMPRKPHVSGQGVRTHIIALGSPAPTKRSAGVWLRPEVTLQPGALGSISTRLQRLTISSSKRSPYIDVPPRPVPVCRSARVKSGSRESARLRQHYYRISSLQWQPGSMISPAGQVSRSKTKQTWIMKPPMMRWMGVPLSAGRKTHFRVSSGFDVAYRASPPTITPSTELERQVKRQPLPVHQGVLLILTSAKFWHVLGAL